VQKEEFCFTQRFADGLVFTDDHPVLKNYQAAWKDIYLSARASEPDRIVGLLEQAIQSVTLGWRSSYSYLTSTDPVRMLREGYGQLLSAPQPIAHLAAHVLNEEGVPIKVLDGQPARWPRRALIAGTSFVVAKEFHSEQLSLNKSLERTRG
jgi:hypothetical protein